MRIFLSILLTSSVLLAGCGGASDLGTRTETLADTVTVVEFSDFNCPACKSAVPLTRELQRMEGVHFEHRHFPLDIPGHELSLTAAVAYECAAAQSQADEIGQALFDLQGTMTEEAILGLPEAYGLPMDTAAYQTCVNEEETIDIVMDDVRAAMRAGLNFTPSFLVNGEVARAGDVLTKVEAAQ